MTLPAANPAPTDSPACGLNSHPKVRIRKNTQARIRLDENALICRERTLRMLLKSSILVSDEPDGGVGEQVVRGRLRDGWIGGVVKCGSKADGKKHALNPLIALNLAVSLEFSAIFDT